MKHEPVGLTRSSIRSIPRRALLLVLTPPLFCAVFAQADLPALPRGVAVLNTIGDKALRDGILNNPDVTMISIFDDWAHIQPNEETFDFESYLDTTIDTITKAAPDKSILLRISTMGGSESNGGHTPDWVFDAMGEDPYSTEADPGVTYSYLDSDLMRCIPVFWQPVYLAKKKALIAMAGAHFGSNPAIKIVAISYANAMTDDWSIPHDNTGSPSEVDLWLNQPPNGAGYTTQKMIDTAIHQGDASFTDGVISAGKTLTSATAIFTQADVGAAISGRGFRNGTRIRTWISPRQVTLSRPASRRAKSFTIKARRDGLIDVAMAAFPNSYLTNSVNGNGGDLDHDCPDPGTCLAETVDEMAQASYPGRLIVQRNNVSAIIPTRDEEDGSDAWVLLIEAANGGMPVAGQALGACWSNQTSDYRMNGGNNCDHDNPDCLPDGDNQCTGDCALSYGAILQRSADRIATYSASYYEIYPPDASNLKDILTYIHDLLDPGE
jgi:hypothetical protein